MTDHSIGTGARFSIHGDAEFAEYVREWSNGTDCDYDGRCNYFGIQHMKAKSMFGAGEAFGILRKSDAGNGKIIPTIQVVDPNQLDTGASPKYPGNTVISGVEVRPSGRVAGYHFKKSADSFSSNFYVASVVVHMFEPEHAGQLRGYPCGITAIVASGNVDQLLNRALQRAKLESSMMLFLSAETTSAEEMLPEIGGPIDGAEEEDETDYVIPRELQSGSVSVLPPGWKVQTAQSPNANGTVAYVKIGIQTIATSYGVQYSQISGDLEKVNFSSQKAGRLEFGRRIECAQTHGIKPAAMQIYKHLAECFEISSGRRATPTSVTIIFPGRETVEPLKDAQADVLKLENALDTMASVISRSGRDYRTYLLELSDEVKEWRSLGLRHPLDAAAKNGLTAIIEEQEEDLEDEHEDEVDTDNEEEGETDGGDA